MTARDQRQRFREIFDSGRLIRSLGVHDVHTGLIAERAGLETVFIGGFGTSASILGLPDIGFITMTEMADAVRRLASRVSIPVIADGDTGHGDLHNVARTVRAFEDAGAAGIILEDQVTPKRCGHFEGKEVIPPGEMELKLKAAMGARRDPDLVIIARTDARAVHGIDEAIRRVNRFGEIGADCVFIEAPESVEEVHRISQEVPYPRFFNMLSGGKTPRIPVSEIERLGFRIAVWPIATLLAATRAIEDLVRTFVRDGDLTAAEDRMAGFPEVKDILGLERYLGMRGELEGGGGHR